MIELKNLYNRIDPKALKNFLYKKNFLRLGEKRICMFEYKNLPKEIKNRSQFIELYLMHGGVCGFGKWKSANPAINGTYGFCIGNPSGEPDPYNIGTNFVGAANQSEMYGTFSDAPIMNNASDNKVVLCYNNSFMCPDLEIRWFAELLTEIDISIRVLVLNARACKVSKVSSSIEQAKLQECFNSTEDGKPHVYFSDNSVEKLLTGEEELNNVMDLTDATLSDKIQYLVKLKDDIERWFHTDYGHSMDTSGKLAQQSVEEINKSAGIAYITPNDMLNCRKKFVAEINETFGLNIEVDFSESWKVEHDEVLGTNDDKSKESGLDDESGEDGESGVDGETGTNGTDGEDGESDTDGKDGESETN